MNAKHTLPIVTKICLNIDNLFLTYVGPVGSLLCKEMFSHWKETHKHGPLEVPYYIDMLAEQIPDEDKKILFTKEAVHLIASQIGT